MKVFQLMEITPNGQIWTVRVSVYVLGLGQQELVTNWPDLPSARRYIREEIRQAFWAVLDSWADYATEVLNNPTGAQQQSLLLLRKASRTIRDRNSPADKITGLITRSHQHLKGTLPDPDHHLYDPLATFSAQVVHDAAYWHAVLEFPESGQFITTTPAA